MNSLQLSHSYVIFGLDRGHLIVATWWMGWSGVSEIEAPDMSEIMGRTEMLRSTGPVYTSASCGPSTMVNAE